MYNLDGTTSSAHSNCSSTCFMTNQFIPCVKAFIIVASQYPKPCYYKSEINQRKYQAANKYNTMLMKMLPTLTIL